MAGFDTNLLYDPNTVFDPDDYYAMWRWLGRVVMKAGAQRAAAKEYYQGLLAGFDLKGIRRDAATLLLLNLEQVPASREFIGAKKMSYLRSLPPLCPPITLAVGMGPGTPPMYAERGVMME
jgi:hypothetical protein